MPTTSNKSLQTEILPVALIQAIQALNLKGVKQATSVQICGRILALQHRHKLTTEDYVQVASAYWEKIDGQYARALNLLKIQGLVQVFTSVTGAQYSYRKHEAKAYRINPDLVNTEVAEIQYVTKRFKTLNLTTQEESWILSDLQRLEIDIETAQKELYDYLYCLDIREWEVTTNSYEYQQNVGLAHVRFGTNPGEYFYRTQNILDGLLLTSENQGKKLYRQGEFYCIDTPQVFKARKVESIRKRYSQALFALQKQLFYAKRAEVNNRVHHNLTEAPNFLLDFITVDGESLVELDVRNSQLACLAYVMVRGDVLKECEITFPALEITPQSISFLQGCQTGSIYQDFAQLLCTTRAVAKTEMFRLLFGGLQTGQASWKQLAQSYPGVADWLAAVKRLMPATLSYKEVKVKNRKTGEVIKSLKAVPFNLAHYLQRVEAEIMIKQVYPELKKAGLVALSKHDSFLVPESSFNEAKNILETVFARLNYKATVKEKTYQESPKSTSTPNAEKTIADEQPNKSPDWFWTEPIILVPKLSKPQVTNSISVIRDLAAEFKAKVATTKKEDEAFFANLERATSLITQDKLPW